MKIGSNRSIFNFFVLLEKRYPTQNLEHCFMILIKDKDVYYELAMSMNLSKVLVDLLEKCLVFFAVIIPCVANKMHIIIIRNNIYLIGFVI